MKDAEEDPFEDKVPGKPVGGWLQFSLGAILLWTAISGMVMGAFAVYPVLDEINFAVTGKIGFWGLVVCGPLAALKYLKSLFLWARLVMFGVPALGFAYLLMIGPGVNAYTVLILGSLSLAVAGVPYGLVLAACHMVNMRRGEFSLVLFCYHLSAWLSWMSLPLWILSAKGSPA